MGSRQSMQILLRLPGSDYEKATQSFNTHLSPYVTQMEKVAADDGPLSRVQAFRDYAVYCRWPIRQLEYSFVIDCLPSEPNGCALDIGSGVTPWPYFLAGTGWPTISVDLEVDQVAAMRRYGLDTYGFSVDHRVADGRGLGFANGEFNIVTCISVLEHLVHADVPIAVAEMIRVCRPGGRIILTVDVRAIDDPGFFPGEWSFPATTLEQIFKPVAEACGVADEFLAAIDAQRKLQLSDMEAFWTQHWKPGFWQEKNRGYAALGLVFDLPADPQKCRELISKLHETALAMEYPPSGRPYHQVQLPDGQKLWMIGDSVLTNALATERFESDVQNFFEQFVRAGDTVFDVGANVGLYEPLLSRLVGPSGLVYAFEPTGQVFGCLVRNCLASDINIRLNRIGLSHENDALTLLHGNHGNASMNSFGEPFGPGSAGAGTYDSEVVWVATLDDYVRDYKVEKIDVLKIDVEGWEERVLRGGIKTLLALAPVLVLEFCSPAARNANSSCAAISELLAAIDYDLFRYLPANRSLEFIEPGRDAWGFANLIAVKRQALPSVLARLRSDAPAAGTATQPAPGLGEAVDGREQSSFSDYDAHDILLLLEENRSLRQRLTSGILDREVTTLYHDLQVSDADRTARLAVIERQAAELSRLPGLEADIEHLKAHLAISEADRVERLAVIQSQGQQLGQLHDQFVALLQRHAAATADRAAQLAMNQQIKDRLSDKERELEGLKRQRVARVLSRLNLIKQPASTQPAEQDTFYQAIRDPKHFGGVTYASETVQNIADELQIYGYKVRDYEIDVDGFWSYFTRAEYKQRYPQYYQSHLYEKSLEHYVASDLLKLNADDIYIDIASEGSPVPEIYQRLFGCTTYRQDLSYPNGLNDNMLGGDAADMPVADGFASKMALHCSFEHFEGDSDMRFIREASRVLRAGGSVCIVPFYLFDKYVIQTDPSVSVPSKVSFDDDAIIYCHPTWKNRHGRFYDPVHVMLRLHQNLEDMNMVIYKIKNAKEVDPSCYAAFAAVITKPPI